MEKLGFLLVIGFMVTVVESRSTSVIQTLDGPVQGEVLKTIENGIDYSSFKGIPYGEPPTGLRRFKPPIKKKPWTNIFNAVKEGNKCVQKDFEYQNYTGSEDCLYLNIYTPHTKFNYDDLQELKPVMFWIYGGSFMSGYGDSSLYGPDFLLEEDVIVVTFNYRLGPLGFLSLEHENAVGNAGLKDQNLALKWVKNNIINFGGDPNSITIFGQSAGGVSVDYHVLSHASKGLFARSISMSASPLCIWGFQEPEDAVDAAFDLGAKLGIRTRNKDVLLKKLMSASALDIMIKANEMTSIFPPFKPTIENAKLDINEEKFITECSVYKYKSGNYFHNPHMMGFMDRESLAFGESVSKLQEMLSFASNQIKSVIPNTTLNIPHNLWSAIAGGIGFISDTLASEAIDVTTDILFKVGIDAKQQLMSKKNKYPIYYYNIIFHDEYSRHRSLLNITFEGSGHGDDLPYLFYMVNLKPPRDPEHPVNIVRKRIVRMWTNFAKYGNPTPTINDPLIDVIWPDSTLSGYHLEIDNELSVGPRPTNKRIKDYARFGTSPEMNGCPTMRFRDVLPSMVKSPTNFIKNWPY